MLNNYQLTIDRSTCFLIGLFLCILTEVQLKEKIIKQYLLPSIVFLLHSYYSLRPKRSSDNISELLSFKSYLRLEHIADWPLFLLPAGLYPYQN